MKNKTKLKPGQPQMPDRNHLLTVANELYLGNHIEAQAAKDTLVKIAFAYVQTVVCDKEDMELLYLLYILLDNVQDEL